MLQPSQLGRGLAEFITESVTAGWLKFNRSNAVFNEIQSVQWLGSMKFNGSLIEIQWFQWRFQWNSMSPMGFNDFQWLLALKFNESDDFQWIRWFIDWSSMAGRIEIRWTSLRTLSQPRNKIWVWVGLADAENVKRLHRLVGWQGSARSGPDLGEIAVIFSGVGRWKLNTSIP